MFAGSLVSKDGFTSPINIETPFIYLLLDVTGEIDIGDLF